MTIPSLFDSPGDSGSTGPARCRACDEQVDRSWRFCPRCAAAQRWRLESAETVPCPACGDISSPLHRFCPWCRHPATPGAGLPLPAAPGFRQDALCDWECGGGVQYPMRYCPWCGEQQEWGVGPFEGTCPHCALGVDDRMAWCPWCGNDATGGDLLRPALDGAERLLTFAGVPPFGYRVLLRPGESGVDPAYPRIVEINRSLVHRRSMDPNLWTGLVGLIVHEIGHSFLYHHLGWGRSESFRRLFGDIDAPYHVPDTVDVDFGDPRFSAGPPGHASHYGQFHPQEDFAETFRYYVQRGGRLDELRLEALRTGKRGVVTERFDLLDHYLRAAAAAIP